MQIDSANAVFKVLSSDNLIYGPIDLATLIEWVHERRVLRETWVYLETEKDWVAAGAMDALKAEFDDLKLISEVVLTGDEALPNVTLDEVRGFERFAPYSNEELALILTYCEFVLAAKDDVIIKKGDVSDSLFFVVSGQVRARIRVGGHDTSLGTMEPGELFGEVAMLSQTARSADVVADSPARLLRLTSANFQELMTNDASLAVRILFNMSRQLATRLAQRNQDLYKDLASSFVWR